MRDAGRRAALAIGLGVPALGAVALLYARLIEPRWLSLRAWELTLPDLPPAWDGLRLVQLSDFHVGGPGVSVATLRRAVRYAAGLRPDLVLLTGDFMHGGRWQASGEDLFRPLAEAAPAYAVLGNHDHRASEADAALIAERLVRQGVTVLRNDLALAGPATAPLVICGLDDWVTGHDDLAAAVRDKPDGMAPLLLLTHAPDIVDRIPAGWFRLALAGHTHGAQIRLSPFEHLSWLQLGIAEIASHYPRGFYEVKGLVLYVNRGLGMSDLPLRFMARPEVTLITLRRAEGPVRGRPWRRARRRLPVAGPRS